MPEVQLAIVLALGFLTEAAAGFGNTLVVVSTGAHIVPLTTLLPVFQPLAWVMSLTIVVRERRHIDSAFLRARIAPFMAPGLVVGMALFRLGDATAVLFFVGLVIAGLAVVELLRLMAGTNRPVPPSIAKAALVVAGVIHGMFGTSGPIVVWVASHALPDKGQFRATLSLLWLLLSSALLAGFIADGSLNASTLTTTALMIPTVIVGYLVGDVIHRRVSQHHFRLAVCVLLTLAGSALMVRALPALVR